MELNGKRLLILGGSRISCEIIRHARALGITTGVTDWYPLEKSPAKQAADEAYYESTSDMDAMLRLITEKKFDGVITGFTDSVLPYYAEMCERAGLPAYGTKRQFELFTDKEQYKKLMREHGVPTIPEYSVDLERFDETTAAVSYPVIVKPSDGSGSRGITICKNKEELRAALSMAREASKGKAVLVEQYVDAPEATVFWLFLDGTYHVSLLGNRHIKRNQGEENLPLPVGYTYPAAVLPDFLEREAPKMKEMFRSVGIQNGMMFMQCKLVDGVCLVYDIGYRMTGSLEHINLLATCGYDPMDMLIRFALTGKMDDGTLAGRIDPYLGGRYAYNVSLLCRPGRIGQIRGLEEIERLPGVIRAVVAHPEGDEITLAMKGRLAQITVRVLGRADSLTQMQNEMLEIQRLAHVISEQGEEMILPGLDERDFAGSVFTGVR